MLQSSETSITEIAMQCGFESVSYFDRVFRKYYWLTPKKNFEIWIYSCYYNAVLKIYDNK